MKLLIIFFCFAVTPLLCARILGIIPIPSRSHQSVFRPLWTELSLRGHQVTVLTSDPTNNSSLTNLTEIDVHSSYDITQKYNMMNISETSFLNMIHNLVQVGNEILEHQFQHPQVENLIKNPNEHFDLVIVESLYPAMAAFAEKFKCPFIIVSSFEVYSFFYESMGNPAHPILNPGFILPFTGKLNFSERLISVLLKLFTKYYGLPKLFHAQGLIVKKYFGNHFPDLPDILKNASLLFVNTDPIFHQIRSLVPTVVQIGGGTHLATAQPLPKDLQQTLDNATQGFIYFSVGTNVKSKELKETTRQTILETFSELPYLVLWKHELDHLHDKPDNVIISKWFPQQDIFRHPNIKLFITQGGLQSIEEAIYSHIPIVGMPFIGDQPKNIKQIVFKGCGLYVDHNILEKKSFKSTILEVIKNPKYRNRVKELAELAQDQPMTGLNRAIWWTEYVLRHKDTKHLKSPTIDLPLYQYFLLDIISFCLLMITITFLFLITILKLIFVLINYCKSQRKVKFH